MRLSRYAWLGVAAMGLLAGCKGFWDKTTTSGSGSFAASGVFYVLNEKTSQIAAMQFLANSSGPTALTGSPSTLGAAPFAMALAPSGSFLYVSTVAGIYVYSVGSTGTLTIANGGAVISQDVAFAMKVDPTGLWLVEVVSGQGTVNAVPILATNGLFDSTRSEKSATLPTVTILQLAVPPSAGSTNPYVFVAMGSGGTAVVPFTAANANPFGTVGVIKLVSSAGGANAVAVDPANRLLYVGETAAVSGTQTGGLRVFTIAAASAINEITGSPYPTQGTGPSAILAGTDLVYVANKAVSGSTDGNITGFALASGTAFSLTSISSIAAGISTAALAVDGTGTYLLAVNSGGTPDLSTFTFDTTTTGKLVAAATAATGTDPVQAVSVVAVP